MQEIPATKVCPKCGINKPASEFNTDASKKDGLAYKCKMCEKIYQAGYREKNRDRLTAQSRLYYAEHREEILDQMRLSYAENPEPKKANSKAYRQNHPEEIKEWFKNYLVENSNKISRRNRKHREDNPWKTLLRSAKRRAKNKGLEFSLTPEDIIIPQFCPILGIPLIMGVGKMQDSSPSLDRIVPEKGYVVGNIAIISLRANAIKSSGCAEEHRAIADWMDGLRLVQSESSVPDKVHAKSLINNARTRAKEHNLPFQIKGKDLRIPALCPILGIPIFRGEGKVCWNSPTIDRIDPNLGYIPSNISIISHKANTIKNSGTAEEHRKIADWMDAQTQLLAA